MTRGPDGGGDLESRHAADRLGRGEPGMVADGRAHPVTRGRLRGHAKYTGVIGEHESGNWGAVEPIFGSVTKGN
ncbi:hypothetical protein [Demequina lutea]|uniref:Uncharacterized protein n=1 Tax=Demequina lutea TaxID=431489 RepID=A0A7Y9ZAT0_9MICO|nr:hypothetical protein [Demequina lutea]NYI41148.1 hypothetical protein [Demequina lutea]